MQTPVTKRLVFFCPGYDPLADSRYRRLIGTGLAQLARRFDVERNIGPVERDDSVPAVRWTIAAGHAGWHTETAYEVLRWDDLVQRDFNRSWFTRLPLLFGSLFEALRGGVIAKLFRLNWHFAGFVIYPWVALIGIALVLLAVGFGIAGLISWLLPLSALEKGLLACAIAAGLLWALTPKLKAAYVYHLLDGWIFSWQLAAGRRPEFEGRLDGFARRIVAAVQATDAQEVLIVGHSTGTTVAVEVTARALALDPKLGERGPAVALLTIGSCLPVVGFVRTAEKLRGHIARLATEQSLLWVEYQAPQDVLNAFGFDPVRDLGLDLGGAERRNPTIRSAKFKETILPATYRRIRWNFFRMHFHFLMPNDIPGEYDYPMIVCGPVFLANRIADPEAAVRQAYGEQPSSERRNAPRRMAVGAE
jgi:pimeloyl-ACP methyl ester carboxylesterase